MSPLLVVSHRLTPHGFHRRALMARLLVAGLHSLHWPLPSVGALRVNLMSTRSGEQPGPNGPCPEGRFFVLGQPDAEVASPHLPAERPIMAWKT